MHTIAGYFTDFPVRLDIAVHHKITVISMYFLDVFNQIDTDCHFKLYRSYS